MRRRTRTRERERDKKSLQVLVLLANNLQQTSSVIFNANHRHFHSAQKDRDKMVQFSPLISSPNWRTKSRASNFGFESENRNWKALLN